MIFLRKTLPWIGLLALIAMTAGLRCWNAERVFVDDGIYFVDADCYSRMTRIQLAEQAPWKPIRYHAFENAPEGTVPHTTAPMDLAILSLARIFDIADRAIPAAPHRSEQLPDSDHSGSPASVGVNFQSFDSLELAGAFISPLLGVLLIIFLWFWGRDQALPWRSATLLVVAGSPILVHGFLLGRPDHQSLILLLVGMALATELTLWSRPCPPLWSFLSAIGWALALWTSLFEPLILLLATLACRLLVLGRGAFQIRQPAALAGFFIVLGLGLLFDGWRSPPHAPEVREFFPRWSQTIGELAPLHFKNLFPWTGWLLPVVPILLFLHFRKKQSRAALAQALLLLLCIALTLWYARWGYFLALVFALSLPGALSIIPWRPLVALLFLISLWPVAAEWERQLYPDPARQTARRESRDDAILLRATARSLQERKSSEPGNSIFLAPWWQSPALSYWSGLPGVAGSSHQSLPGIADSARFYLSTDPGAARSILAKRNIRFVVAYEPSRILPNSAQILGVDAPRRAMGEILYRSPEAAPDWLTLVFKNAYFKVYEVRN